MPCRIGKIITLEISLPFLRLRYLADENCRCRREIDLIERKMEFLSEVSSENKSAINNLHPSSIIELLSDNIAAFWKFSKVQGQRRNKDSNLRRIRNADCVRRIKAPLFHPSCIIVALSSIERAADARRPRHPTRLIKSRTSRAVAMNRKRDISIRERVTTLSSLGS